MGTFPTFTEVNADVLLHQGITLRERLLRDKRSSKIGVDTIMGATYYRELRQWYSGEGAPMTKLKVKGQ